MIRLLISLFLLFICTDLKSQSENREPKSFKAFPIKSGDIKLDGRLDDTFWSDITGISDFLVQEPVEGGEPTEKTTIKIAYDENYLYIGAIFYDSEPDGIKAFKMRKDAPLNTDDRFMWILDTYLDGRNAYFFEINPRGLMGDGLLTIGQGRSLNKDWDGIWRPWTYIGDFGWSAEIRIPFHTLNFDPKTSTWGINFQRTIRRKNEEILWSGHKRNQGIYRPQDAGRLTGLNNISQGLGLELVGYGKAEALKVQNESEGDYNNSQSLDGGLDVNYNITPGLKASLTVNTDFAETEVDDRQINLTRFPIRFPEKRDFFLEGANIFRFAPSSGVYPYFSRKIGLRSGNPIPILYGGRVIGKIGKVEVAAQQVKTRETDNFSSEEFSVIRLKQNFLKESSIGVLYTRRHTNKGKQFVPPLQDRNTLGIDLTLNTSTFLKNQNLQFQAFAVIHNPELPGEINNNIWDRSARGLRFNFPNDPWSGSLSYREFGVSYDPAVGFSRRNSFRRVEPRIRFSPILEKSSTIRELKWEVRGIEGKISAIKYVRENNIPFFGICLGMQCACIEFSRNILNKKSANSSEFDRNTDYPIIDLMEKQKKIVNKGGTMRLGSYKCKLSKNSIVRNAYKMETIEERHRHRYEFNSTFKNEFNENGMITTGINEKLNLVEVIELKNHPWFVGTQYHPEYKSRVLKPHPLFISFVSKIKSIKNG